MFKKLLLYYKIKKSYKELNKNGIVRNISQEVAESLQKFDNSVYITKTTINGNLYTAVAEWNFFGWK